MTPRVIFWLASGVGAAIFIVLGTLLARLRAQPAPVMLGGGGDASEAGALRREVDSLQERLRTALAEGETLRTKLREALAEGGAKADDFGETTTVNDAAAKEAALRIAELEGEREKWVADRAAAQAALAERERKLAAVSQGAEKARAAAAQAVADLAKARQETALARRQAEEAKKQAEGAKKQAEGAKKQAATARQQAEEATQQVGVEKALRRDLQAALDARAADHADQRSAAVTLRGTGGEDTTLRARAVGDQTAVEAAEAARAYAEGALVAAQARLDAARKEIDAAKRRLAAQEEAAEAAAAAAADRLARQEVAAQQEWAAREADLRADYESHLERLRSELEVERQIAEEARADVDAAQARVASTTAWAERAEALETERFELRERVRQLEAQVEELSELQAVVDEHESMKLEAMALRQRAGDAKRLAHEITALRGELADVEASRAELAAEVERLSVSEEERVDLALRVQVLESHLVELKALRQEKAAMVARESEIVRLRQDLEVLRNENADLRAQGFIVSDTPLAPRRLVTDGEGGVAGFERLLAGILEDGGARCAVLADELGLVVAGSGDYADALAALSAMHDELARRVGGLLPLGTVSRISLADENGLYFTAQPVMTDAGRLLLATVSVEHEFNAATLGGAP